VCPNGASVHKLRTQQQKNSQQQLVVNLLSCEKSSDNTDDDSNGNTNQQQHHSAIPVSAATNPHAVASTNRRYNTVALHNKAAQ